MNDQEERRLRRKIEKALADNKLEELGELYGRLARDLHGRGRDEEALASHRQELEVYQMQGKLFDIANANRMIGEMLINLGQFEDSQNHINLYLNYAVTSKDKVEEQRALATLGRLYFCWASELKSSSTAKDKLLLPVILQKCQNAYIKSLYICENKLMEIKNKEKLEMKAKVLLNLGLAFEVQDKKVIAQSYFAKAISICKSENLYEDLHRSYLAQGEIYLKHENPTAALASFDLALNIVKKIPNSVPQLEMAALQLKADAYFSMCNYIGAENILRKAYKLKCPNENEKNVVRRQLQRAVVLNRLEKELQLTKNTGQFLNRKKLYERHGDVCCSVRNYKHAIQSYFNMLDCAQKAGESDRDLLPCYNSLTQTYKDIKQYDLALSFSKKELQLTENDPREASQVYATIGEILELKGSSYDDIMDAYSKAKEQADISGDTKLKIVTLECIINTQQLFRKDELAAETERELVALKEETNWNSDQESKIGESEELSDSLEVDVDLSNSDDSEEYDRPKVRAHRNLYKIKKNEKGETLLHLAAIKGNIQRVRELIGLGHPVKARDVFGWTPLHEASNHGHTEVVKLLLENGADVNDVGGSPLKGLTPLHDAATNGHLDVVRLLLEKGASINALTDSGVTPLDCLAKWERKKTLDEDEKAIYERLAQQMKPDVLVGPHFRKESTSDSPLLPDKKARKSAGQETQPNSSRRSKDRFNLRRCSGDFDLNEGRRWRSALSQFTSVSDMDSEEEEEEEEEVKVEVEADGKGPREYRAAMNAVRKRVVPMHFAEDKNESQDKVLVPEEEYVEDWLEDDLGLFKNPQKRRKTTTDLIEHVNVRNLRINESASKISEVRNFGNVNLARRVDDVIALDSKPVLSTQSSSTIAEREREQEVVETETARTETNPEQEAHREVEHRRQSQDIITHQSEQHDFKVRVTVIQQLLMVPIERSRIQELTVGWLAEEASKRYLSLEGQEPVLRLQTKDGASLFEKDPLSLVVEEELQGVPIAWKSISQCDRYRKACTSSDLPKNSSNFRSHEHSTSPDVSILARLELSEVNEHLNLEYLSLTPRELEPVFFVLNYVKNLQVLNLNGNVVGDDGVCALSKCLEKCNVRELHLACNNITSAGVKTFSDSLCKLNQQTLDNFQVIDLSFNPLGDAAVDSIDEIVRKMSKLKVVHTDHCDFSRNLSWIKR